MSQFGADKFTTRAREAIEGAQLSATTAGNTNTEPIHLLVALLRQAEGTAATLVGKAGVDARAHSPRRRSRRCSPFRGRPARPSNSPRRRRR